MGDEDKISVCVIKGKEVLEVRRERGGGVKGEGEVYVGDGKVISYGGWWGKLLRREKNEVGIGGFVMWG